MRKLRLYSLLAAFMALWLCAPAQFDEDEGGDTVAMPAATEAGQSFGPLRPNTPVAVRRLPAGKVRALQQHEDYWYANAEPEKKEAQAASRSGGNLLSQPWFRNVLWMVILFSFIGVVLWYLVSSDVLVFRRKTGRLTEEATEDEAPGDIFSINYDREIAAAEAAGNYRGAVRLLYLRTLKELAGRNIISYVPGKTNTGYVAALHGTSYYSSFAALTRHFEYTCYGGFPLRADAYRLLQADFLQFQNRLRP